MSISSIHNKDGYCIAYCEWSSRDVDGKENPHGKYAFVDEMWIHKSIRGYKIIKQIMNSITKKAIKRFPNLEFVYWERRKYNSRIKLFRINELVINKEV